MRRPDLSEGAVLADLRPPAPPAGVPAARWRRNRSESGDALSFYRGKQVGQYEAYLAIVEEHPRIARKILKAFRMDEHGVISVEGT